MSQAASIPEFDLTYAGALGDKLFPVLNALREAEPVYWDEKAKVWIVTRHQDIADALMCKVPVSNVRLAQASISVIPQEEWPARLPNLSRYAPHQVTNIDPPIHTRMRLLLTKAFGRPVVESIRPYARATVANMMRQMHEHEEVEFADIALSLPGTVILKLLGLPDELFPKLRGWADAVMRGLGAAAPEPAWIEATDRAFAELTEAVLPHIAERRASPPRQDDFLSSLVYAKNGADGLTDDEIIGVMHVTVIAGHDTTVNTLTMGVRALAEHPAAWMHMRAHPEAINDQIAELMRYIAMSAAQNRAVAEDFTWHGKQLKKGDTVFLMFAAGNRDPRAYTNPEALDLTRKNDQSLTFGPGLHHCIGHLVAKMQLNEFFSELVQHFDGAEILNEVEFANILVFRAIPSLRMRFFSRTAK